MMIIVNKISVNSYYYLRRCNKPISPGGTNCYQAGIPCAAISAVTDRRGPDNLHPVLLKEIIAVVAKADTKLSKLFAKVIESLSLGGRRSLKVYIYTVAYLNNYEI